MDVPLANFQNEIYLHGLAGQRPAYPIATSELERRAYAQMTPEARGYVAGGAGGGATMRANRAAYDRWRIVPRMLRDVASRDLSVDLFGQRYAAPVLLAPIGVQSIVHGDAEVATARAASGVGVPFVLSTASSRTLEDVAEAAGDGPRWFQLYWPNDVALTRSFVHRAEKAGYSAIVVTLDTSMLAWRPADLEAAYLPFLKGEGVANYFSDPVFREGLEKTPEDDQSAAILKWISVFSNPGYRWEDLATIRAATELPILLKGILHPDDARAAVKQGMDGLIVSNHGGRQVDGAVAALDALPVVVDAVGADIPVLTDSGIRTASDAIKAIALGARAVLLGRPFVWGLALGGEEGVRQTLRGFLAEFDLTLGLSGHRSLASLDRSALEHQG